jgi:hypothetical protein
MTVQTDVKAYHNTQTGVAVAYRTRLKGVVVSPSTSSVLNVSICDNNLRLATYDIPGTTVCTVTLPNHGLTAGGSRVVLNFTSGTGVSNTYLVQTTPTTDTFTVTTGVLTTSGNVSVYSDILIEIDVATATAFYTLIPGEGVLATNGVYVFLPSATVATTIFYG